MMHVTQVMLLACTVEAHVPASLRRINLPSYFTPPQRLPQGRPNAPIPYAVPRSMEATFADAMYAESLTKNAGRQPTPVSEAAEVAADWPMLNVYDEPLESCSSSPGDYFCTFNRNAPAVCVAENADGMHAKPISWSDADGFQCVSIWDSGSEFFSSELTAENNDLLIKCNALPSEIFHSQFSVEKQESCEIDSSNQCHEFHSAIEDVCNTCASQASSATAKHTIQSKCKEFSVMPAEMFTQTTLDISSIATVAVISFMIIVAVIFSVLGFSRRTSTAAAQPLL